MNEPLFSRYLTAGTYRVVHVCVRVISVLVLLLLAAFVFLRMYGVPGPLLREVVRRVNAAGIPVEVDSVALTLRGWRAENVRYYSPYPDDLVPVIQADEVFLSLRGGIFGNGASKVDKVDLAAVGITLHPSLAWGIELPTNSPLRHVGQMDVSLGFFPDRILVSQGKMESLGLRFSVAGTILKRTKPKPPLRPLDAHPRVIISDQQFQTLATRLNMLSLTNGATVDVGFIVDTTDLAASRIDINVQADGLEYGGIGFSKAELVGSYAYPAVELRRIGLFQDKQSIQLSGQYDLKSKEVTGTLYNSISSNQSLKLLPATLREMLLRSDVRIANLPRLEINFGPAPAKELLNHVSGNFSILDASYMGVEIETLRGQVVRANNRIEFKNLQGSVRGQEQRAGETGSAMHGGSATGEVFWDGTTREFGVKADASLDPNLLVRALATVEIATNIIRRFSFRDRPPRGHLELGANVDDWDSFHIDIQALGNDVVFQGVEFSSINVTETYTNGLVNLDPVAAMQGVDFMKGSVVLDFNRSTASFDGFGSMNPAALEDVIYPELNFFGSHLKVGGKVQINAQGTFDWATMQQTDFSAKIEAERVELPFMAADRFKAEVVGKGPAIMVRNATFGLYGGLGQGGFSMQWNPGKPELPYKTDFAFTGANFRKCLEFCSTNRPVSVSGTMEGNGHIEADLSTNFFAAAIGSGFLAVNDGQLADLPLFQGFSWLMRKVFPGFTFFSITSLKGNFVIKDGTVGSEDAYFNGDVLSAKGRGIYSPAAGFNAYIQVQVLSESMISKVVRVITDPLLKLLELRLEGPLSSPTWRLENFPKDISSLFRWKKE
ncbi:MAG: AsmA-like C-terminal region-containing protein [Kiritimatiellales bacterium]|nr:AsmA-like C-terminal region-containing protein [Kiritimatiellales bacterium]